jgi:hypothetical protein
MTKELAKALAKELDFWCGVDMMPEDYYVLEGIRQYYFGDYDLSHKMSKDLGEDITKYPHGIIIYGLYQTIFSLELIQSDELARNQQEGTLDAMISGLQDQFGGNGYFKEFRRRGLKIQPPP